MKRRLLLDAAAAVALVGPLFSRAQRPAMPVIGYLSGIAADEAPDRLAGFRRGLFEAGYGEGKNVAIEYRWAQGDYDRLPALAAELVRHPVSVLVATGGPRAVLAAKGATALIPIVFTLGGDSVKLGLVRSLGRPGGNVTGVSFLMAQLTAKRFELLRELVPKARLVGLLVNPNTPSTDDQVSSTQQAAAATGTRLQVVRAGSASEIDAAFASLAKLRPDAVLIGTDAFLGTRNQQLIALAQRHRLPAVYEGRPSVEAGGLISYGPNIGQAYAQAGAYVGRILAGIAPADLPVLQPTTFELTLNLKTAAALGLAIPQSVLVRADEVIR